MAVTPTLTSSTTANATGTATTMTAASLAIGTAAADRVVVIPFNSDSATTVTATIGGVSANILGTAPDGVYIASAVVPTGTTASLVVSGTGMTAGNTFPIGVWALSGASGATPSASFVVIADGSTINVGAGGAVIAWAGEDISGTWTGVTQASGFPQTKLGLVMTTGSFANSGGAITGRAISYSDGFWCLAAAFDASGGGGDTLVGGQLLRFM